MQSTNLPTIYEIVEATGAWKPPWYVPVYAMLFEPIRTLPLAMLELGIHQGGSMKAWEAYFPAALIAGVDIKLPQLEVGERVRMFAGDQADCRLLSRIASEVAPGGFDVIIDDCSHIAALTKTSFWHLFDNHLKPGALYCIEDWGTGYMPDWPDGRELAAEPDAERRMPSHDGGMVGFVKQLVDELHSHMTTPEQRVSKFGSMTLTSGLCIITKAGMPIWPAAPEPVAPEPAAPEEPPASPGALHNLLSRLTGSRRRGGRRKRGY